MAQIASMFSMMDPSVFSGSSGIGFFGLGASPSVVFCVLALGLFWTVFLDGAFLFFEVCALRSVKAR
eukprot:249798-Alexandrium_andersonii.AAC.1